jgi:hypothetical protein
MKNASNATEYIQSLMQKSIDKRSKVYAIDRHQCAKSLRAKIAAIASLGQHGCGLRFGSASSCGGQSQGFSLDAKTEVRREAGLMIPFARNTDCCRSYCGVCVPVRKTDSRRANCASTLCSLSGFAEPQNGSLGGVPWPSYGT